MADIIQLRRDTAANWTSADPTLAQGELGIETDTGNIKAGDGSTAWSSLDYLITAGTTDKYASVSSSSNTTTLDCSAASLFSTTLTENTTIALSNVPSSGTAFFGVLEIINDSGASGYTVGFPAGSPEVSQWPGGTAITLTATANARDVLAFYTRDGGTTVTWLVLGQDLKVAA